MNIQYKAILTLEEDKRFLVQFPSINEAFTEGQSLSEALFNAQEVLNLSLEGRLEDGIEIPPPDTDKSAKNEYLITPEVSIQSALLIHFNRENQSLTELAKILNIQVQEIEKPKKNMTLDNLENVAHAMGKQLIIDFA
jgi:antitoxin HicB